MESFAKSIFFVGRMNAGLTRGTTTHTRDSSDLDKGYIPNGVNQCHRNRIIKPLKIMRTQPSLTAAQPRAMAAEITSKGFSILPKPHEHSTRAHQSTNDAHERSKMSRSEAGSKGGKSLSPEEHARSGSQSHKNG